jgi:hypothetical protein
MVKKTLLTLVVLAGLVGVPRQVMAGCTVDLADCYGRAAARDNFWMRTAVALDCELDFADCVRRKLIGR